MLRCLGNVICSGLDETAAAACENKALFPALGRLLATEHQHIRKECLWVLSNITGIGICDVVLEANLLRPCPWHWPRRSSPWPWH